MAKKYILSIDQGTTGTRAFIFDSTSRVISSAYQEFKQYYPKPGWVEHDPQEIWVSVVDVIQRAKRAAGIDPKRIAAIAITNQRETTVLWDRKTAQPVYHAIVWQCRRSADRCARLKPQTTMIRQQTGLVPDAYFSATKIQWLLDLPGVRRRATDGKLAFGTIDSWLIYKLTQGASHVTDMTNASRTMIFDIKSKKWSPSLLKLFNIPETILPQVQASSSVFGHTASVAGLPAGIPIMSVMGDQQAALYGHGCFDPGEIKNTYGTGCFMLLNTGKQCVYSKQGLLTTLGCDAQGSPVYVLEGSVFIAGAIIQWLRDGLKIIKSSLETEDLIKGLEDTQGVYLVPALVGLGAPYWDPHARGMITGISRGTSRGHIVRAALESMAYQTKEVFDIMGRESCLKIKSLSVDGGASRNNFLMQFQADMLHIPIVRPSLVDATAAGTAYLAGVAVGLWTPKQILQRKKIDRTFKPQMSRSKAQSKYEGWRQAIRQTLTK